MELKTFFLKGKVQFIPVLTEIKGIVQPFELGGETRLIRSAVKY
jgi:hypothetical protein